MSQDKRFTRDQLVGLFLGAALAVLTLVVYRPCFAYPFVHFDDPAYVTQNAHVQAGLTAESVRWAFTTFACGNWHPLTWLSLQLDCTLYGGLKAGGFHLTNVLLHTASALLLFLVLARMTGLVWRSAVVAALFALHPLNVEPVAWVAERKGVLATLLWTLSLAAYLYYVRRPGVGRYLLVVLALVLGLMAKPMLLTLPFVLLLLDYWPLKRLASRQPLVAGKVPSSRATSHWPLATLLVEKLPLLALVLAWSVVAFLAQRQIKALPSLETFPLDLRVWNAFQAYMDYIGKMLWPMHLAAYYPHPGATVSVVQALASGLVLVIVTVLVLGPGRRWPYLPVGWLWYLGTLVPTIGLVQIGRHGMADRYTYIPLIGLFLLLTWGVADVVAAWRLPRFCVVATTAVVLCFFVALTRTQLGYWRSDVDLWKHALGVNEINAMAHNNLGMHYFRQSMIDSAELEFEKAVSMDPGVALFHHNFGLVLADKGVPERALAEYRKAIDIDPGNSRSHNDLGTLLRDLARSEEALAEFQKAADLDPGDASPHIGIGNVLLDRGRPEEALAEYRRAIELDPDRAIVHKTLAMALQETGRLEEALAEYRKASELGFPGVRALVQGCERLRSLRERLPRLLAGRDQPADNGERLAFADLCRQPFESRYALAARLYAAAFKAEPRLADDPRALHRMNAASAAARAGCGQGHDAAELDEKEKADLRDQALRWLRVELTLLMEAAQSGHPQALIVVQQSLRMWQHHAGLAGVREPAALAKLPEEERAAWHTLWQDVEALLAKASAPQKRR